MDKNIANKVLGWLKIILKDPPVEYDNLYSTMSVPQPIKSLGYEDEIIISLIKNNLEDFYEWGKMGDKVIIPKLQTYDYITNSNGSEYVRRAYSNRTDAYDKEHLKSSLSACNPCYDEGEEVDYEILDFDDVEWDISDIEQITEDINRVKEVMGLKLVL